MFIMTNEYPCILYRSGKGTGEIVWNHRINTYIVNSLDEEEVAIKKGWVRDPNQAVKGAIYRKNIGLIGDFFIRNWQWLWGTCVAIVLAISFFKV